MFPVFPDVTAYLLKKLLQIYAHLFNIIPSLSRFLFFSLTSWSVWVIYLMAFLSVTDVNTKYVREILTQNPSIFTFLIQLYFIT